MDCNNGFIYIASSAHILLFTETIQTHTQGEHTQSQFWLAIYWLRHFETGLCCHTNRPHRGWYKKYLQAHWVRWQNKTQHMFAFSLNHQRSLVLLVYCCNRSVHSSEQTCYGSVLEQLCDGNDLYIIAITWGQHCTDNACCIWLIGLVFWPNAVWFAASVSSGFCCFEFLLLLCCYRACFHHFIKWSETKKTKNKAAGHRKSGYLIRSNTANKFGVKNTVGTIYCQVTIIWHKA